MPIIPAMLQRTLSILRFLLVFVLWWGAQVVCAAPFTDTMAQRTLACTGCHGAQGRAGPDGYYPRLAGKPQGYLFNQLLNLRDGRRHYGPMQALLQPLTPDYLLELARYFSQLDLPYPPPTPPQVDAASLRRGKQLALDGDPALELPPCTQCHGKALVGALPHVPGLLGLSRDYLNAQLGGWRTHQRQAHAPDCMAQVAGRLQPSDVAAVTHWLAAQAVPAHAQPQAAVSPWPAGMKELRCGSAYPPSPPPQSEAQSAQVLQGAYLARIGNCAHCHTAPQGAPYAGGRRIETPFGAVFSSNITPESTTGLGGWSSEDFWQAMHHGRSQDGRLLSPAFPYTSFTWLTRADSDALFAFLQSLPAVVQTNRAHALRWPLGTQLALSAWRALFFTPQTFEMDPGRGAGWNRGAYLAQGLGHCEECHTPRNRLGGRGGPAFSGADMPGSPWRAPSLREPAPSTGQDRRAAMAEYLRSGQSLRAHASGPMADVVQGGTQYLSDQDLQALLTYIESLPQLPSSTSGTRLVTGEGPMVPGVQDAGAQLYRTHCAACHGDNGQGVAGAYPALAANPSVLAAQPNNMVFTILRGGFAPVTQANPRPFGMPPFQLLLGDAQVAQVASYVRRSWGNQAPPVQAQQVTRIRNREGF